MLGSGKGTLLRKEEARWEEWHQDLQPNEIHIFPPWTQLSQVQGPMSLTHFCFLGHGGILSLPPLTTSPLWSPGHLGCSKEGSAEHSKPRVSDLSKCP